MKTNGHGLSSHANSPVASDVGKQDLVPQDTLAGDDQPEARQVMKPQLRGPQEVAGSPEETVITREQLGLKRNACYVCHRLEDSIEAYTFVVIKGAGRSAIRAGFPKVCLQAFSPDPMDWIIPDGYTLRLPPQHTSSIPEASSCLRTNQLRVLLTAAAYVLYQELRLRARVGEFASAQVSTLRERLLKLGVYVESSVRRIVLHLPDSFPYLDEWLRIARSVGAVPAQPTARRPGFIQVVHRWRGIGASPKRKRCNKAT